MSLAPKSDFLNLDCVTHLAAGGQTPMLKAQLDALDRFAWAKGTGLDGQRVNEETRARTAGKVAALIGVAPDDIGFPSSVAQGVTMLAESLDWRMGDNVVLEAWEFPSLMYPFLAQRRHGVEVRAVTPIDWRAPAARLAEAVDSRTRVIAVSHVSYFTGERHDLEAYAELARRAGALLIVDASHALGSVRVHAPVADAMFSCCYKFVLGTQGAAVAYWNRARLPEWRPRSAGWHSVIRRPPLERTSGFAPLADGRAFEPGNPTYSAIYALECALDYLDALGMDRIESHTLALSGELRARLVASGLPVLTPEPAAARAGSIAFASPHAESVRERLEAERVLVTGEDGRVRVSVHVYNGIADVEQGVEAIHRIVSS